MKFWGQYTQLILQIWLVKYTVPRIIDNLKDYQWSSYPSYLDTSKAPSWLNKETTLNILGCKNNIELYTDFVETNRDKEIYTGRKNIPSVMGSGDFKKISFNVKK